LSADSKNPLILLCKTCDMEQLFIFTEQPNEFPILKCQSCNQHGVVQGNRLIAVDMKTLEKMSSDNAIDYLVGLIAEEQDRQFRSDISKELNVKHSVADGKKAIKKAFALKSYPKTRLGFVQLEGDYFKTGIQIQRSKERGTEVSSSTQQQFDLLEILYNQYKDEGIDKLL